MRYWWVNQNQTYRAEIRGSFMWSPKQTAKRSSEPVLQEHARGVAGDIVFSFCDARIKAIGASAAEREAARSATWTGRRFASKSFAQGEDRACSGERSLTRKRLSCYTRERAAASGGEPHQAMA